MPDNEDQRAERGSVSPGAQEEVPTRARYGVLGLLLIATAISYLDRVCISMAAPFLQKDLALSDAQMGMVFSAFTLAYAVFEIPAGWMADRFGPRLMLTRVVVWWSVMTAVTGVAWGFVSLLVVRFLFGAGEAGVFPGLSRVYARWLPGTWRGNAFGLAVMTGLIGGAITQKLTAEILARTDGNWRLVFGVYSLAGLVWGAVWYWWFRDEPSQHGKVNEGELRLIGTGAPEMQGAVPWRSVFTNRAMILLCGMYFGVIYGWYFFLTWMPKYLLKTRGFDLKSAGWFAMLPLICMAVGVAGAGWASDRLVRRVGRKWGRRIPGLVGLPIAAGLVWMASRTLDARAAAFLLAAGAGFATFGVAPGWAACLEIGGAHAGVVTGTMNTFGNLGGTAMPLVAGLCLKWWNSWDVPLMTVAFFYLFSAVCWLGIDATDRIGSGDDEVVVGRSEGAR